MSPGPIAAVLLAAGGSRRLGTPKQLLALGGEPLVRRTARLAVEARLAPVVVVVGHEEERVRAALSGLPVATAANADWRSGIASSIAAGLAALARCSPAWRAVVFLACDQPLLAREHLETLASAVDAGAVVAASSYAGTYGVPAAFARALEAELLGLAGDAGARGVVGRHLAEAALVPFAGGQLDVDTPEDRARILEPERRGSPHTAPAAAPSPSRGSR